MLLLDLQQQKLVWSVRLILSRRSASYLQQQKLVWSVRPLKRTVRTLNTSTIVEISVVCQTNSFGGNVCHKSTIVEISVVCQTKRVSSTALTYLQQQKLVWSVRPPFIASAQRSIYNSRNQCGLLDFRLRNSLPLSTIVEISVVCQT